MLILLNPHSNHGKGHSRWLKVKKVLEEREKPFTALVTRKAPTRDDLSSYWEQGHTVLIAAGGDGTVSLLINTLMDPITDTPRFPFTLGAIGLGSSNDFHKPRSAGGSTAGIPVLLDHQNPRTVDLGKITFESEGGEKRIHYFAINASYGVTALGNFLFNNPGRTIEWAKPRSVSLAIAFATAGAIRQFKPVDLKITTDHPNHHNSEFSVNNLGILKNVHFTGSLRYDTPVQQDDGLFDVNLYEGLNLAGMLSSLFNLARGRFIGTRRAHHWRSKTVHVTAPYPVPLEADGEVFLVAEAKFEVVPSCLRLCR
jgi:diacylglycerol kinase family enzyme